MTSLFGAESPEVVRIRVKKCDGMMQPVYKKMCVDPQITSFEILQNLLSRAFNLRGDFTISYLAKDDHGQELYLSMLSDWDVDAAFLSASDPCLRLKVNLKPFDAGLDDWDVVGPVDIPKKSSSGLNLDKTLLGSITESITSQVGKTVSQVSKVMGLKSDENKQFMPPKPPMSDSEFHNFMNGVGQMVQPKLFRLMVYQGGVEPSLRKVVWRHLLNIFPDGLTGKERFEYLRKKNEEYRKLKEDWKELFRENKETDFMKHVSNMVKKDVLRTDRMHEFYKGSDENENVIALFNILVTYALTHPEVAYCQGMSDIVSPLLLVQKEEGNTYMCFCGIMERLRINFSLDGSSMTNKFLHFSLILQHYDPVFYAYLKEHNADDLFFCYRWLLLELKREFPLDEALYMLEVMWSSIPPDPPHTELSLADPIYYKQGLHFSPGSPSCGSEAYLRLRTKCRHNSLATDTLGSDHSNNCCDDAQPIDSSHPTYAITPCEDVNPKDFMPVDNDITTDLKDKSETIDRSLEDQEGENPNPVAPSIQNGDALEPDIAIHCSSNDVETDSKTSNHHTAEDVTNSFNSLNFQDNHYNSVTSDTAGAIAGNPKRPSEISLKKTYPEEVEQKKSLSALSPPSNSRQENGQDLSSCEEATEHPSVDFVKISDKDKLPKLPSPQDIGQGNPFLLFLGLALLEQHRDHIMANKMDYNDLAMHFDKMVRKHNVLKVVHQGKSLYGMYLKNAQSPVPPQAESDSPDVSA